ncbi:hypothetical protein E1B28_002305 [Marasmius oreades]|nr:uncharacterized protein E1B28_002305 [Marasmius oreades]KAG7086343.1 hypothetical protein E1B28_002305 [Marasmius oreades]
MAPKDTSIKNSRFATVAKTCVFWAQGRCINGDSCTFRHDPVEPLQRPSVTNVAATDSTLRLGRSWASSPSCVFWAQGICTKGESCTFRHDSDVEVASGPHITARPTKTEPTLQNETILQPISCLKPPEPCIFWARGRCAKGDGCTFLHEATTKEALGGATEAQWRQVQEEPRSAPPIPQPSQPSRPLWTPQRPCIYWTRGCCDKGDRCTFGHDPAVKDALYIEVGAQQHRASEELAERERLMHSREAGPFRLDDETRRLKSGKTIQYLALGSTIVKFGAGLNVERVVPGFDARRIRISNLPLTAKYHDVCCFLDQQGMQEEMYHLVDLRSKIGSNSREANLVSEAERGKELALGLDNTDFCGQALNVEIIENGNVGGMDSLNGGVLLVSWWLPSRRFVATYFSQEDAVTKLSLLNGEIINGRKIRVDVNRRNQDRRRGVVNRDATSLFISGVPMNFPEQKVRELFRPNSFQVLPVSEYDEDEVEELLKGHVNNIMNGDAVDFGGSVDFEPSRLNAKQGTRSIRMKFSRFEDAKVVHDQLNDKTFFYIGDSKFLLTLSDPYQIIIPIQQYNAQKKQWDAFVEDTKGKKDSVLHLRVFDHTASLRVGGNDTKAVGMLKVRVERIEGIRIPAAIATAQGLMEEEIKRLSRSEYTQTLKPESVRFFIREGLSELREAYGKASVTLDFSTPARIAIRGGDDARQSLRDLVDRSLSNVNTDSSQQSESSCPICLMDVDTPVKLGCGHEYCTACLRHFFAADINKFPILCVGNDCKCGKAIVLPVIQKYMESESEFNTLLDKAFTTYIERNQPTFRYCKTPDCKQLYRSSTSTKARQCPSCLAPVCTKCHEEGHDGMTCEERHDQFDLARQDRLNEEWAKGAGAKRCPSCKVWIEKTEGCNHMSCKCGAHICWVCMRVFGRESIYDHMNKSHGGIFDI